MANKQWKGGDSGGAGDWSIAANWNPSGVPGAADNVFFTSSYVQSVDAGLDQSSVALGELKVGTGYTGSIGTTTGALQCDPTDIIVSSGDTGGQLYFDIGAETVDVQIDSCSSGGLGTYGVQIRSAAAAIGTLIVNGGKVGVVVDPGESVTLGTARVSGGVLHLGSGTTLTNLDQSRGTCELRCSVVDIDLAGGVLRTSEASAISTSATVHAGQLFINGSGTVASLVVHGGDISFRESGVARTVTACTLNSGSIAYDPQAVTITTFNVADRPVVITATT